VLVGQPGGIIAPSSDEILRYLGSEGWGDLGLGFFGIIMNLNLEIVLGLVKCSRLRRPPSRSES
jgi:hypothetical protein